MPPIDDGLILLTRTLEALLLPPGVSLLLGLAGLVLALRRQRVGLPLVGLALVLGYLGSLPLVARGLALWLETYPVLDTAALCAEPSAAIVVLGGPDRYAQAPEYGGDTLGPLALERVRYAARLHRACGLPILAVGGKIAGEQTPGAQMMAAALAELGTPVTWADGRSRSTLDNARYARELLAPQGIATVALVTHAWHLPRAVAAFEAQGLRVLPAPTGLLVPGVLEQGWRGLLPSARTQVRIGLMLRELLGLAWQRAAPGWR